MKSHKSVKRETKNYWLRHFQWEVSSLKLAELCNDLMYSRYNAFTLDFCYGSRQYLSVCVCVCGYTMCVPSCLHTCVYCVSVPCLLSLVCLCVHVCPCCCSSVFVRSLCFELENIFAMWGHFGRPSLKSHFEGSDLVFRVKSLNLG